MQFYLKWFPYLVTPVLLSTTLVSILANSVMAQNPSTNLSQAKQFLNRCREHLNSTQFQAALQSCQEAVVEAQRVGDDSRQANALINLGNAHRELNHPSKAIELYQQGLTVAQKIKNREAELRALINLTGTYNDQQNYPKIMQYGQPGIILARELKNDTAECNLLISVGRAYQFSGNPQKGIESYQQALPIARRVGDRQLEWKVLFNLAFAYDNGLKNYAEAEIFYNKALPIVRVLNNRRDEWVILNSLAILFRKLKDNNREIQYALESLSVAKAIPDLVLEYRSLGAIGLSYFLSRDLQQAIPYLQQQIKLADQIGDPSRKGEPRNLLGEAYNLTGEYAKAVEVAQQAIAIAQQIGDAELELAALSVLINAYGYLADEVGLVEAVQQQLALAQKTQNRSGEMDALGRLGVAYLDTDPTQSLKYFQQQLELARSTQNKQQAASALQGLADTYIQLREFPKVVEFAQQSLAVARDLKNGNVVDQMQSYKPLFSLGFAYMMSGDRRAIDYLKQAVSLADSLPLGVVLPALQGLAIAYTDFGQYPEAIATYQTSLAKARQFDNPAAIGESLEGLGDALARAGRLPEAEKVLYEAIQVWESIRQEKLAGKDEFKISIFESQSNAYQTLQKVLIAQNRPNEALEIAERGRARAFVELLSQRLSPGQTMGAIVEPLKIEQIRQVAKDRNATLVQYSLIPAGNTTLLLTWLIAPDGKIKVHSTQLTKSLDQLTDLVTTTREAMGVRGAMLVAKIPESLRRETEQRRTERLRELYQLLIEPIAQLLPADPDQQVIFVPQGALFLVPFPALLNSQNQPLISKHTLLTIPSIQTLAFTQQLRRQRDRPSGQTALILGNPVMPPGFDPLPGAKIEAEQVAALLNAQAITGSRGTKPTIVQKMAQAQIIHLATHGIFDNVRGLGSALTLAPSGNDKGLLTAEEILAMSLKADLVVLSACDTGRGQITGDGVIGLSRSFISAGVPSVIVSLWSVPDAPTAELMINFYQNWHHQKMNKAQALRRAMLTTMSTHPDPKNWAAFTLIGEAE